MNNECLPEEIKLADGEEQELRSLLDYNYSITDVTYTNGIESIFEQDKQLNIIKKRKGIVSE